MRIKNHADQLECRCQLGGKLLAQGKGVREVARLLDVAPSAIWRCAISPCCPISSHSQWIRPYTRRHLLDAVLLLDAELSKLCGVFGS